MCSFGWATSVVVVCLGLYHTKYHTVHGQIRGIPGGAVLPYTVDVVGPGVASDLITITWEGLSACGHGGNIVLKDGAVSVGVPLQTFPLFNEPYIAGVAAMPNSAAGQLVGWLSSPSGLVSCTFNGQLSPTWYDIEYHYSRFSFTGDGYCSGSIKGSTKLTISAADWSNGTPKVEAQVPPRYAQVDMEEATVVCHITNVYGSGFGSCTSSIGSITSISFAKPLSPYSYAGFDRPSTNHISIHSLITVGAETYPSVLTGLLWVRLPADETGAIDAVLQVVGAVGDGGTLANVGVTLPPVSLGFGGQPRISDADVDKWNLGSVPCYISDEEGPITCSRYNVTVDSTVAALCGTSTCNYRGIGYGCDSIDGSKVVVKGTLSITGAVGHRVIEVGLTTTATEWDGLTVLRLFDGNYPASVWSAPGAEECSVLSGGGWGGTVECGGYSLTLGTPIPAYFTDNPSAWDQTYGRMRVYTGYGTTYYTSGQMKVNFVSRFGGLSKAELVVNTTDTRLFWGGVPKLSFEPGTNLTEKVYQGPDVCSLDRSGVVIFGTSNTVETTFVISHASGYALSGGHIAVGTNSYGDIVHATIMNHDLPANGTTLRVMVSGGLLPSPILYNLQFFTTRGCAVYRGDGLWAITINPTLDSYTTVRAYNSSTFLLDRVWVNTLPGAASCSDGGAYLQGVQLKSYGDVGPQTSGEFLDGLTLSGGIDMTGWSVAPLQGVVAGGTGDYTVCGYYTCADRLDGQGVGALRFSGNVKVAAHGQSTVQIESGTFTGSCEPQPTVDFQGQIWNQGSGVPVST